MNRSEAIDLLDHAAGEISEEARTQALEALADDAEALRELEARRQVDLEISRGLQAIAVPEALRSTILVQMAGVADQTSGDFSAAASEAEPKAEAVSPADTTKRSFWLRPWMVGAAAALAVGIFLWQPMQEQGAHLESRDAEHQLAQADVAGLVNSLASRFGNFGPYDHQSRDFGELTHYIHTKATPTAEADKLPGLVPQMQPMGCRVFEVDGHRVSMICMQDESFFHLIVTHADACGPKRLKEPTDFKAGDRTFVAWHEEDRLMMLVSREPAEHIHQRLSGVIASR